MSWRNRQVNEAPTAEHVEDPAILDALLTDPPVKRIDLWFELGDSSVSASNFKGVTIKDALKAIHKRYKTKVSSSHSHHVCTTPFRVHRPDALSRKQRIWVTLST